MSEQPYANMPDAPPQPPPSRRFARELTTIVVAPVLIWLVGWAPAIAYAAGMCLVSAVALWEFLILGERKGYTSQKTLCILLMTFMIVAFVLPEISVEVAVFAVLLIIPAVYVFTEKDIDDALPGTAVCVLATLYVGMLGGTLVRLRIDFPEVTGKGHLPISIGSKLVFFLLLVVWFSDAGAYYFGRAFGKHKLWPRVSPKKTVEGGIGGMITSLLGAAMCHYLFFPEFPLHHALIASLFLSTTGVIGDLAESLWKRSAAVKDSGGLIPGHGGFLDRADSIFFTAPILYAYWFLITHNFRLS